MLDQGDIQEHIQEEIARGDFCEVLREIENSRRKRYTSKTRPTVIDWEVGRDDDSNSSGFIPPEGSVMCFWARKENDILRKLESAYVSHDTQKLDRLYHAAFQSDFCKRSLLSLEEAKEEFVESDVFFDLRYNGKVLAESLWESNEERIGLIVLPFSGGEINKGNFTVIEHSIDQDNKNCPYYQVLIVVCSPVLSDIEKRALEAVPPEMGEIKIGRLGPVVQVLPGAVTVLITITLVGTACVAPSSAELEQAELSPELIEELGSTAAVERLVKLRSEIFEEYETVS